ncbi:MAG TPA: MASE1 domain-containing protein, partial [Gemmatimonadales bacterium]|nr:MASE1 domain-containing protein [Gemmatimonadales bacterium]
MAAAPPSSPPDPGAAGWTPRRIAVRVLGLAAAYVLLSRQGYYLSFTPEHISPLWAPAGLGLAAALLWGPVALPGIFLGDLAANLIEGLGGVAGVLSAIATTLEVAVVLRLLGRWPGFERGLRRLSDVVVLVAAGLLGAVVGASLGVVGLWAGHGLSGQALLASWRIWWIGDALGVMLVTPLLLVWTDPTHAADVPDRRTREWWLALGCLAVTAFVGLTRIVSAPTLLVPAVMWLALRFGLRGGTLAAALAAVFSWWSLRAGAWPLSAGTPHHTVA